MKLNLLCILTLLCTSQIVAYSKGQLTQELLRTVRMEPRNYEKMANLIDAGADANGVDQDGDSVLCNLIFGAESAQILPHDFPTDSLLTLFQKGADPKAHFYSKQATRFSDRFIEVILQKNYDNSPGMQKARTVTLQWLTPSPSWGTMAFIPVTCGFAAIATALQ